METNKQKLTELLCTVPEIKEDIMELRLWTQINIPFWEQSHQYTILDYPFDESERWEQTFYCRSNAIWAWSCKRLDITEINEIIWNPLDYHHLMMYCVKKDILFEISDWLSNYHLWLNGHQIPYNYKIPFSEQSEEFYWEILDYLNNN